VEICYTTALIWHTLAYVTDLKLAALAGADEVVAAHALPLLQRRQDVKVLDGHLHNEWSRSGKERP
jgi:hypothetical protein